MKPLLTPFMVALLSAPLFAQSPSFCGKWESSWRRRECWARAD